MQSTKALIFPSPLCYFTAMSKHTIKSSLLLISILFPALFLDQLSKVWFSSILAQPWLIISDFFNFHIEHNVGMAFSITFPYPIQLAINILFFGAIIFYLVKNLNFSKPLSQITLALLAAGALGNLLDRIRLGYVIDFISVGTFPVFNLADSFITVSVFLLVLFYDKIRRPGGVNKKNI